MARRTEDRRDALHIAAASSVIEALRTGRGKLPLRPAVDTFEERSASTPAERFKVAMSFAPVLPCAGAVWHAGPLAASILVLISAAIGGAIDGTNAKSRAVSAVPFLVAGLALFLMTPLSIELTGGVHKGRGDSWEIWTPQLIPAFLGYFAAVFGVRRLTHGRWGP